MTKVIRFQKVEDILAFVALADACPYHMDICCGNLTVDAKSIMAMMAMGIGKEMLLKVYTDDVKDLSEKIEKFAA